MHWISCWRSPSNRDFRRKSTSALARSCPRSPSARGAWSDARPRTRRLPFLAQCDPSSRIGPVVLGDRILVIRDHVANVSRQSKARRVGRCARRSAAVAWPSDLVSSLDDRPLRDCRRRVWRARYRIGLVRVHSRHTVQDVFIASGSRYGSSARNPIGRLVVRLQAGHHASQPPLDAMAWRC